MCLQKFNKIGLHNCIIANLFNICKDSILIFINCLSFSFQNKLILLQKCDQICVKNKKIFEETLKYQYVYNKSHKMLDSMTKI